MGSIAQFGNIILYFGQPWSLKGHLWCYSLNWKPEGGICKTRVMKCGCGVLVLDFCFPLYYTEESAGLTFFSSCVMYFFFFLDWLLHILSMTFWLSRNNLQVTWIWQAIIIAGYCKSYPCTYNSVLKPLSAEGVYDLKINLTLILIDKIKFIFKFYTSLQLNSWDKNGK